jgi:hypothetical protein
MMNIWDGLSDKYRLKFYQYIDLNCSPKWEDYDDDMTMSGDEDMKKVAFQVKVRSLILISHIITSEGSRELSNCLMLFDLFCRV